MKTNEKPVTEVVFESAINSVNLKIDGVEKRLDEKIDGLGNRLDAKIDRVAISLLKTQEDVEIIKATMATKQDVNLILNRIDSYVGKNKEIDQEQFVQALHIKELKETSRQHEQRISALEKSNAA